MKIKHSYSSAIKQMIRTVSLAGLLAAGLAAIHPTETRAQGPFSPPPMLPDKPRPMPIDGGLALLAAAGGGYAIKKLRDKKK